MAWLLRCVALAMATRELGLPCQGRQCSWVGRMLQLHAGPGSATC
jgi:hypothetical protein